MSEYKPAYVHNPTKQPVIARWDSVNYTIPAHGYVPFDTHMVDRLVEHTKDAKQQPVLVRVEFDKVNVGGVLPAGFKSEEKSQEQMAIEAEEQEAKQDMAAVQQGAGMPESPDELPQFKEGKKQDEAPEEPEEAEPIDEDDDAEPVEVPEEIAKAARRPRKVKKDAATS